MVTRKHGKTRTVTRQRVEAPPQLVRQAWCALCLAWVDCNGFLEAWAFELLHDHGHVKGGEA